MRTTRAMVMMAVVLATAVATATRAQDAAPAQQAPAAAASPATEQTVEVTAERFAFQPSEITVPLGTTLNVVLKSDDTTHGFRIKGEGVNVQVPKRGRGTVTATFTPAKAGKYTFECSRICGAGHGFMRGTIVVVDRTSESK
ncbi:MAG: cupredoxin domain-containing protein [Vicinamibacteraceae bacterium]